MPFDISSYQVENDNCDVLVASQIRGNYGDNTNDNGTWGGVDIFVTKFNQSGREWIYQISSRSVIGNVEMPVGVDLDQNDNLYVFGTTNSDFTSINSGGESFIIFKLDSNGNQVWKKKFGTNSSDSPHLINFNENTNEIWLFGSSRGDLDNDLTTATSMIFLFK